MDHESGAERLRRQYLECGEVAIDVRDVDGLLDTALDMNFDMNVANTRFSPEQLAAVTGSEFSLLPETEGEPRSIEATISYLIDAHGSNPEHDLYDIYDHLVTRLNYDHAGFAWLPRMSGSHTLTLEVETGLTAAISIDDLTDGSSPQEFSPGVVVMRIQLEGERSDSQLRDDILAALRLWGNLHDAVSYPQRGRHAIRHDQPFVITIREFQPTDDMLVIQDILMSYEHDRLESNETWPVLDMSSVDTQRVIDALGGMDEARLRTALATLLLECRNEYGRTGEIPVITNEMLISAIGRTEQ